MNIKSMLRSFAAGLALGLLLLGAPAAMAVPAPPPSSVVAAPAADHAETPFELAHGCHRGVMRDYRGWHFHTGACVRRNTAPPGLYDYSRNRRFYRGPLCSYQCRSTGPVKTCQQICR